MFPAAAPFIAAGAARWLGAGLQPTTSTPQGPSVCGPDVVNEVGPFDGPGGSWVGATAPNNSGGDAAAPPACAAGRHTRP